MSLYDGYQLAESSAIPKYQGSAIPELEQSANTFQGRYDTGQQYMDATQQAMAQQQALPQDQGALAQLNQEKQQKLDAFAQRGDLENVWRDTMMEAKDYANRSKYFTDNMKRVQDFTGEVDKRQQEGKINPETARAAKVAALDGYKGLQSDGSGKYTNQFTGQPVMNDVDIPKKINEWLTNAHPEVRGGEVKKDINGWYITNGSETKRLPMAEVMKIVKAGTDADPEVMPWIRQESTLAPYKQGITSQIPDSVILNYYKNNPAMLSAIQHGMAANNTSAAKVLQSHMAKERGTQLLQDIQDYASKGVVDERTSKHLEEMDPITEARLKKEQDNKMIPMNYVAQNSGAQVKTVGDYEDLVGKHQQDAQGLLDQYNSFIHDPSRKILPDGRVMQMVNGQQEDASLQASQMYHAYEEKQGEVDQLNNIKKAAATTAGYDPTKAPKSVLTEAARQRDLYLHDATENLYESHTPGARGTVTGFRTPTQDEIDVVHSKANEIYSDAIKTNTPRYKEYEAELAKRANFGDEQSKIWGMPNDAMKTEMGDMLTGLGSKLGLKNGMLSFNIANGPNQGQQIDASSYDEIKGKVTPIGITHSSKDGSAQIIVRGNEDIKGKKTTGENMILSVPDAGWLDDYVKTRMTPEDRHQFYMDGALKTGLNNPTATMKWENITDKQGRQVPIAIRRNRAGNSGDNAFVVTVPGKDGRPVQVPVNSYEGVTNLLDHVQAEYQK